MGLPTWYPFQPDSSTSKTGLLKEIESQSTCTGVLLIGETSAVLRVQSSLSDKYFPAREGYRIYSYEDGVWSHQFTRAQEGKTLCTILFPDVEKTISKQLRDDVRLTLSPDEVLQKWFHEHASELELIRKSWPVGVYRRELPIDSAGITRITNWPESSDMTDKKARATLRKLNVMGIQICKDRSIDIVIGGFIWSAVGITKSTTASNANQMDWGSVYWREPCTNGYVLYREYRVVPGDAEPAFGIGME